MRGRRLPDLAYGQMHEGLQAGDYWKILNRDGSERRSKHPENLTGTSWYLVVPLGKGYGIAWLENHTVREHEDGTISVRPNDGSSNSILVGRGAKKQWHGYVEHGVLIEA